MLLCRVCLPFKESCSSLKVHTPFCSSVAEWILCSFVSSFPQVEQHRNKDWNKMRRRNERMSGRRIDPARLNRLLLGGRNFNTNNVRRWQWGRRTGNGMERKGGSASHFVNNHNCYSANLWESFNHGMCNQFVLRHCVNYAQSVGPSQHPGRNQWQP